MEKEIRDEFEQLLTEYGVDFKGMVSLLRNQIFISKRNHWALWYISNNLGSYEQVGSFLNAIDDFVSKHDAFFHD